MTALTTTHLFAGGCGDLRGFTDAGFTPVFAANHDQAAIDTVKLNFPTIRPLRCDITNLDFRSTPKSNVLVGSPICTEISPAGGNATPKRQHTIDADQPNEPEFARTRATAWCLIRADEVNDYDVVCGENVPDFLTRWRLADAWLNVWDALGKNIQIVSIDAAHISGPGNPAAPQHRNRVVFCFSRKGMPLPDLRVRPDCICPDCGKVKGVQQWARRFDRPGVRKVGAYGRQYHYVCPTPRCHLRVEPVVRAIREHIDFTVRGQRFGDGRPGRKEFAPYAPETRRKVEIGLRRYDGHPFIVIMRRNCTVQSLDEPLSTVTAEGNHHMLVVPGATLDDSEVQMLGVRPRAAAQRFPTSHEFAGNETQQRRQVGNAVPVNVAHWLGECIVAA